MTNAREWARLITMLLARGCLCTVAGLLVWSVLPAALGWRTTVVQTGSMQPAVAPGDAVVFSPVGTGRLHPGEVVLVRDPAHPGRLLSHRISAVRPDGSLITKGDANTHPDSTPVPPADLLGVGRLVVPKIGLPVLWVREDRTADLVGLVAATVLIVPFGRSAGHGGPDGDGDGRRPRRWSRRGRRTVVTGGTVVGLAVAVLLLPSAAYATFSASTSDPGNTFSAAPYFTCRAAVLADTPFAYYRLDESATGSGKPAADSSGNNHPGTYRGTVTANVAGACPRDADPAVTLDGATGYLSTSTLVTDPQVFTVEVWFKTTTARGGLLIGFGNTATGAAGSYDRHLYMTNSGQIVFGVYPNQVVTVVSPASYNDGRWHLADGALGPAGMVLSIDGQPVATNPDTSAQAYNGYWRLGYDSLAGWVNVPTSAYFAGSLDEAAVYSTTLGATQIAHHYAAGS